jgi:hypothetical protein
MTTSLDGREPFALVEVKGSIGHAVEERCFAGANVRGVARATGRSDL